MAKRERLFGEKFINFGTTQMEGITDNNIYTFDQIYNNYLSFMKEHFNNYIRDIRVEQELIDRHREATDKCLSYLIEKDYRADVETKLSHDFELFIEYCNHYKKCFQHFLERLTNYLQTADNYWDREALVRECGKLIPEVYMAFDQNIPYFDAQNEHAQIADDYFRVFGYDFRQLLTQHIEQHIRRFEVNVERLYAGVRKYGPDLQSEYRRQSCARRWLNSSNEWLHSDNKVYFLAHRELEDRCAEYWHKFGDIFERKLNSDTKLVLNEEYSDSRRNENFVAGIIMLAGVVGAGVSLALGDHVTCLIMGVVALLAVLYFITRKCVKPKDLRAVLHGHGMAVEIE
ncbi:unnamed protein product [Oppiella nova]|uniref:Uncharacterized protein n=1 Tax=Oppiella nova TaxID=334625 RepID=A0A7R9QRK6_9ACAR|nr:unnamed protein product [Oppiella nova]CAG2171749.1 unnamed protein product [Oppiella nova]